MRRCSLCNLCTSSSSCACVPAVEEPKHVVLRKPLAQIWLLVALSSVLNQCYVSRMLEVKLSSTLATTIALMPSPIATSTRDGAARKHLIARSRCAPRFGSGASPTLQACGFKHDKCCCCWCCRCSNQNLVERTSAC